MLRLAFDFIITWRETRTRPNAYVPAEGSHREKVSGRGRILQLHQPVHIAILGMNTLYP